LPGNPGMPAGMPQADDSAGSDPGGRLGGALSDGARSRVKAQAGAAEVPAGAAEGPAAAKATSGPRAFNPLRVGRLEAAVWVAYYRGRGARFLVLSIRVGRSGLGMDGIRRVQGAGLVLRANQLWAPPELGSDVAGARRCMRRFYALLRLTHGVPANPARAAELEVEWWGVHRRHQRGENGDTKPLVDALSRLYAFSFGV